MQNKNVVLLISIIGVIVITFTIAAFILLDIERSAINGWALTFLLLSELGLFCGLVGLRFAGTKCTVFLNAGVATALSLYFVITLISVLLAGAFGSNLSAFILLELAVIALTAIIAISIVAFSHGMKRRDEEYIKKTETNVPKRGGL